MKKIGITGGIGSGKTLVCEIFSTLGVPVYTADSRAKELINTSEELRNSLIKHFGQETYTSEGYNTAYVAQRVFNNPAELQKLNELVHPVVQKDFEQWLHQQSKMPYIVYEAAILFETGGAKMLDGVIVVDAPLETRVQSILKRDNTNREAVEARMRNQWPTDKKRALADWIIENNDKQLLLPQVLKIHNELK